MKVSVVLFPLVLPLRPTLKCVVLSHLAGRHSASVLSLLQLGFLWKQTSEKV